MKVLALACILTLGAAAPITAFSADNDALANVFLDSAAKDAQKQRSIDGALAPIKSSTDLRSYVLNKQPNSPLNRLSPGAQKRFIESIQFNEKGVTTYDYADLRAELTASQVYEVLALFGIQGTTAIIPGLRVNSDADRAIMAPRGAVPMQFPDYPDMMCESRATCSPSVTKICTSNC
ncbi:MAG TPA: hypothetical protein VJ806_00430 [Luteimonas sp.]|nr:hypothetical protein [Luteimonas sp.]